MAQPRLVTNFDRIHFVVGNESCDLDSAVSAIVLAYMLHVSVNVLVQVYDLVVKFIVLVVRQLHSHDKSPYRRMLIC